MEIDKNYRKRCAERMITKSIRRMQTRQYTDICSGVAKIT